MSKKNFYTVNLVILYIFIADFKIIKTKNVLILKDLQASFNEYLSVYQSFSEPRICETKQKLYKATKFFKQCSYGERIA